MSSSSPRHALVVGLGGVTNGGKTTICRFLENHFKSTVHVQSIHLDNYFRSVDDPHHIYLPEFDHLDWDILTALNTDRFISDLISMRLKCDLLLVEGFLIFNVPFPSNTKPIFDLAYYFDLEFDECRKRRIERIYDPPDPPGYFDRHVWQAYGKAKKEAVEKFHDKQLIIVNTAKESFDKIQQQIVEDIETAFKNKK